jgi:hypothetical protein
MPRSEELFAFEILRRVLGADVTLHDDGSKRAMVDGLLTMPDGTLGAVEVTTLGTQDALELISLLAGRTWHVEGARWAWHVWLPQP